jgi:AcrR family transcriptional regulator
MSSVIGQPPDPVVGRSRDTYKSRLPRGPHSLSREQVADNQRWRLMRAMVDAVGEQGYAKTTVSDVIGRARVSRKAFYQHFANRKACLLATYDWIVAKGMRTIASAYHDSQNTPDNRGAAIRVLFERMAMDPNALRLVMLEIGAAGPEGIARREQLIVTYEQLLRDSLGVETGSGAVPNPVLRAVVGGLNKVIYTQVVEGSYDTLATLVVDLVGWTACYHPAPDSIVNLGDHGPSTALLVHPDLWGGRAPGTLSIGFPTPGRRRAGRGGAGRSELGVSHSLVVHSQRERILDAVANITARGGYAALTVEAIASAAGVSLQAFYEHFCGKEDAFVVAYEIGHAKGLAIVQRAYAAEADWRTGIRAAITALFAFLACEPAFAHLALVDALVASPRTAQRSSVGVTAYAQMLLPGLEHAPPDSRPPEVVVEAIVGGLFELCLHHTQHQRLHELPALVPRATYFALTPFIGPDEAARVATTA